MDINYSSSASSLSMIGPTYYGQSCLIPIVLDNLNKIWLQDDLYQDYQEETQNIDRERFGDPASWTITKDQSDTYFSFHLSASQRDQDISQFLEGQHDKIERKQCKEVPLVQEKQIKEGQVKETKGEKTNLDQAQHLLSAKLKTKLDKKYEKNLPTFIWTRIFKTIKKDGCLQKITRLCQKQGILVKQFLQYCNEKNCSGQKNFFQFLNRINDQKIGLMNGVLRKLLKTMFRKSYLTTILKEGKMQNIQKYIEYKNLMHYIPSLYN